MKNNLNMAIQVLPQSDTKHPYDIVDKAIEVIQQSGLKYKVCPFETVMEGTWEELMQVAQKIHEICYENGTKSMMTYIKIQSASGVDVAIEDKMHKYESL